MEGGNYIVSWCFGHLVELADASSYDERYAKWRYDDLPIVPGIWMFEVTKDKAQPVSYTHLDVYKRQVREDIDEKVKEARQIMTKVSVDMIGFYFKVDVPKCSNSDENTPFADAADDEAVTIPKDKYELMIDDLLTMSEIIQCVADMRTQDVKAIREFGKFVPAFAAFEKNRLSLYLSLIHI